MVVFTLLLNWPSSCLCNFWIEKHGNSCVNKSNFSSQRCVFQASNSHACELIGIVYVLACFVRLLIGLLVNVLTCLFVCFSNCLLFFGLICLLVYLFVYLFVCLPVYLFFCLLAFSVACFLVDRTSALCICRDFLWFLLVLLLFSAPCRATEDLNLSVLRCYLLTRHYCAAIMWSAGIKPAEPHCTLKTIQIMREIIESPVRNADGSGAMLVIRIPSVELANLAFENLKSTRDRWVLFSDNV